MDIYRLAEKKIGGRLIRLHNNVYQKTNGRIGHRIPACRHPRADVCTYKDAYLIVASISGSFRYPNWYHNLRKNSNVEINIGAKRFKAVARKVTPAHSDNQRLWQIVNKNNFNQYERYQHRTSRPLPIFELRAAA